MKKRVRYLIGFVILTLVLATYGVTHFASANNQVKPEHLACTVDTDCTSVQLGSCACLCRSEDMGVVNKQFATLYQKADYCSPADLKVCATMGYCTPPAARCVAGQCTNTAPQPK